MLGCDHSSMAPLSSPSVVSVLPDKLGGALNIVEGLFKHRRRDSFAYGVVLTHNPLWTDARFGGRFNAEVFIENGRFHGETVVKSIARREVE